MIIFTQHAIIRMKERVISRKDVKIMIQNPDNIYRSFDDRVIFQKKIKSKTLEVIIKKDDRKTIILTCYWL